MNEYLIVVPIKEDTGPEQFRQDIFKYYVSGILDDLDIATRKLFCYTSDSQSWVIFCSPEQMTMVILQLGATIVRTTVKI